MPTITRYSPSIEEIVEIFELLEIGMMADKNPKKDGDMVVYTKFNGRNISMVSVSKKYEIFDISKFAIKNIRKIYENFQIHEFALTLKGGVQEIQLVSDQVEVDGIKYSKIINILNSTNKSHALSMSVGFRCHDAHKTVIVIPYCKNLSINKKHFTGITDHVDELFDPALASESFQEQLNAIAALQSQTITMSNTQRAILGIFDPNHEPTEIELKNYQKYNQEIAWEFSKTLEKPSKDFLVFDFRRMYQYRNTKNTNELIIPEDLDFEIATYTAFAIYMRIFRSSSFAIVKKECDRFLNGCNSTIQKRNLMAILED